MCVRLIGSEIVCVRACMCEKDRGGCMYGKRRK
jgi:hypothetical protein